jgi:ribonuclease E
MSKKLLIDAFHDEETRIAVINEDVVELYDSEITSKRSKKGNVYLGRVTRIEPSLQSVFVDYGEEKQGFLSINEIHPQYWSGFSPTQPLCEKIDRKSKRVEDIIQIQQVLPVQILKDAHHNKGAFLTTYINLSGRYCILMPNSGHRTGGVSRRIEAQDRLRLKQILLELGLPEGMSVILRSAVEDRTKAEIKRDLDYLMRIWRDIYNGGRYSMSSTPIPLYLECNLVHRALRDIHDKDIDEILIDGYEAYKAAKAYMKKLMPSHVSRIQLHKSDKNIFSHFGIEKQIKDIFKSFVPLPSGGSIVINITEALIAIDVNSGKTKEKTVEETALTTNLEAVDAIALHVRLRNLSGIIVVDFIDMEQEDSILQVEKKLKFVLKEDRAKIEMGKIGEFGLLEFSRQRTRTSLTEHYFQTCYHCHGQGKVRIKDSVALSILRSLENVLEKNPQAKKLIFFVPPYIDTFLLNEKRENILFLEKKFSCSIFIIKKDYLYGEHFEICYE